MNVMQKNLVGVWTRQRRGARGGGVCKHRKLHRQDSCTCAQTVPDTCTYAQSVAAPTRAIDKCTYAVECFSP